MFIVGIPVSVDDLFRQWMMIRHPWRKPTIVSIGLFASPFRAQLTIRSLGF